MRLRTRCPVVALGVLLVVTTAGPAFSQTASELFERGVALHGKGRYAEAIETFDAALELEPSSETYRKRGLAWRELGRFDKTYADYDRALAADPGNARVHRSYAMALQIQERYDEALGWCLRGLEVDPDSIDLWITRGAVERDMKRDDDALASFEKALQLDPKNKFALNFRGLCRSRKGEHEASLADYDRALAIDPGFSSALGNRALALLTLRRPKEAIESAQKAIDLGEAHAQPYCVLGRARVHLDQPKQALPALDRCLELEPENRRALLDRSWARLDVGDAAGALADADRLVALDPEYPQGHNNRGAALERLGRLEAALAGYQEALRLAPGYQLAEGNLARVAEKLGVSARPVAVAAASPTTPSPPPPTAAAVPPGEMPLLRFSPTDDPCRLAALPADGLPWQPAGPGATPAPVDVAGLGVLPSAPFLELETMSRAQWTGAVSAAVEGLRIAYGAMSEEDSRRFEAAWTPLYDSPSQVAVVYLNRLNPLLGQLLAGREALVRAIAAAHAAIQEAAIAVEEDDRGAWESAMAMADRQGAVIESLAAGLERLAAEIQALGNPPNPFDERCQAQQRYRRAFRRTGSSPIDGVWITEAGTWESFRTVLEPRPGVWVVYRVDEAYYDKAGELAAMGFDVSRADVFEIDDGSDLPRMGWTLGILDHLRVVEGRDGGRRALVTSYGPAMEVHAEVWELVAEGVADRVGVTEPAPAFGGDPVWAEERLRRELGTEPLFSHQHTEGSVRTAAEPYLPHGLAAFDAFTSSRGELIARLEAADVPEPAPGHEPGPPSSAPPAAPPPVAPDPAQLAALEETIAFHEDMAKVLERNLDRERAELERTTEPERRRELALRMLTLQADIQAERDLAASYRTGAVVHTRTAYDDWAQQHFVQRVREEAARVDAARRIAAGVERQIELLPWQQRAAMRARARELLDPATIARGDVEKARQVAAALNDMVQGYWEGEAAREEEKAIAAEEHEFITQTVVMTAGTLAVGFGSAAAIQAFGEASALALWAPQVLGGVYGGVTGTIAGGPGEGLRQSIMMASPSATLVVEFVDGYRQAIARPGATGSDAAWEGAKLAGTSYLISKSFQLAASLATRGALAYFGKDSRLFRPVVGSGRPGGARLTASDAFDEARYRQARDDAQSLVNRFQESQVALMRARTQFPAGSPQLAAAEREARGLAMSLNSSFHCKWLLKYKSHPSLRRAFSGHVGAAYDDTLPVFEKMLQGEGYDTSNLRFRQFRNASSAGTSSMDLDLGLQEPPGLKIWKTDPATGIRREVPVAEFQRDGQRLLNRAYHETTGFSAPRSEVNLTTSVHDESFASTALLGQRVDFDTVDPRAIRDIGRVVDFKASKVQGDPVLGRIAKLQAKCRESSKEVDNMLLRELRQARAQAPPGSAQQQQLDADIRYWEDLGARLKQIGTDEIDPHQILMLDRQIRRDTGGRGADQVVEDLAEHFRLRGAARGAGGS